MPIWKIYRHTLIIVILSTEYEVLHKIIPSAPFLRTEGIVFQIHCLLETSYREIRGLLELMEQLDAKGIGFVSKKEAIDTTTPTGKFMLTVFAAVAELEREYILQRQREGIAIAKQAGKYKGRKPIDRTVLQPVLDEYRKGNLTATQAMRKMNVSKSTFYRMFQQKNNESFKRS